MSWKIILKFNIVLEDEIYVETSLTWILLRGPIINSYFIVI